MAADAKPSFANHETAQPAVLLVTIRAPCRLQTLVHRVRVALGGRFDMVTDPAMAGQACGIPDERKSALMARSAILREIAVRVGDLAGVPGDTEEGGIGIGWNWSAPLHSGPDRIKDDRHG